MEEVKGAARQEFVNSVEDAQYWSQRRIIENLGVDRLLEELKNPKFENIGGQQYRIDTLATLNIPKELAQRIITDIKSQHEKLAKQIKINEEETKVKLQEAYNLILDELDYWMDLPEGTKKVVANWIICTYFHEQFNTFPYLFLNAMRGSGKTRLLRIISHLANQGDGTVENDMTQAVLFRMKRHKILCIDELENIGSKEKTTLRQLLNSAYKKGTKVSRMKKVKSKEAETFETESFEPYFPIAMANIWGMDEVLGDRAITLILEKSENPAKTKLIDNFTDRKEFLHIKSILNELACSLVQCSYLQNNTNQWNEYIKLHYNTNNIDNTKLHQTTPPLYSFFKKIDEKDISGRNFELAFPLLIVSNMMAPALFEEQLDILGGIMKEKQKDEFSESKDVSLFDFVSRQSMYRFNYVSVKKLVQEFRAFLGDEDTEDIWLNEKWLGRALKRLSLIGNKKRKNQGMEILLNVDKAIEKAKFFKSKGGIEDE